MRISPERHFNEDIPIDCLLPGKYEHFSIHLPSNEEI